VIGDLAGRLEVFATALKRGQSVRVNARDVKDAAINLSKDYFQVFRPQLSDVFPSEFLVEYDGAWQRLLELAHGSSRRSAYISLLAQLKKATNRLSVAEASIHVVQPGKAEHSALEKTIIGTLERLVPSAGISYRQGLADLLGPDRLSYRGSACELRESFREVLDHLAPDKTVEQQSGFACEAKQTRPTMKQKVRFIFRSRGQSDTAGALAETSLTLIENIYADIARAFYNRASLSTHVQTTKKEVEKLKRYIDTVLCDLLEIAP
jgi:hypothetical protein